MGGSPHLEVQIDFEASGILTDRGDRGRDSARRIDNDDALPGPQEREQVVDERRVAEMNTHEAAVLRLPTPGASTESVRGRPSSKQLRTRDRRRKGPSADAPRAYDRPQQDPEPSFETPQHPLINPRSLVRAEHDPCTTGIV
jgi:hypothetical protein